MKSSPSARPAIATPVFYGGGDPRQIPPYVSPAACQVARIRLAPGTRIGRVLSIVMTRRAYRRYVYPALAEMQAEYFEALAKGHLRHARWIAFRGQFLIIPGWLYGLIGQTIRRLFAL